jgi:hypothetical protein
MYQPSTTSYPLPTPATRWWRTLALLLGLSLLLSSLPLVLPISLPPAAPAPTAPAPAPEMARLPLSFVPNAGQSHPDVRFQARGLGGTIFFTPEEVTLTLPPPAAHAAPAETLRAALSPYAPVAPVAPAVVRLQFSGANPAPEVRSGEALPGTVNYFIGSDPAQWQTNLSTYAGVVYADLYDGIDLVYDGTRGTLKGTYTVAPGSDPARIGWRYAGAEDVRVDAASGNLHIRVAEGHTLTEHAPIAWQTIDGERVPVAARYTLAADGRIGFALGAYDDTHPLIIDPTLEYSTYLGGGGNEAGRALRGWDSFPTRRVALVLRGLRRQHPRQRNRGHIVSRQFERAFAPDAGLRIRCERR